MSGRIGMTLWAVWSLAWTATDTFAQQSGGEDRKWEVEVHAGGIIASNPSEGRSAMPAAGESFTTVNARSSRYVSSWYFGDGAALANESAAAFTTIVRSSRIAPLDPVLTGSVAKASDSANFGFRVNRRVTPRISAEFNLDYGPSRLKLSQQALSDIEATRASFENLWTEVLASTNPLQFQNKVVVSSTEMTHDSGGQLMATGGLNVKLRRGGALTPYVTAGVGGLFSTGPGPRVELRGSYAFLWTAGEQFNETDAVVVRWTRPDRALVGAVGGGVTYDLSRRHGVRADVRFHLSSNAVDTEVSTTPSTAIGTPSRAFASATTPSVQFSNNPDATAARSSLSAPAIAAFKTREGSGVRIDTAITVGYFWRF